MDILPLPFTATLDQYQQQAEETLEAFRSRGPAAMQNLKEIEPQFDSLSESEIENRLSGLARLSVARLYDFETWHDLAEFAKAINLENSSVLQFESAVEAIVTGDADTLRSLLRENPELIRMRSLHRHNATLLIYVGANGVEYYRQKTPKNVVEIARILLDAGSEIEAIGTMYRGTTTLGLVATSAHPYIAGVQNDLIDILLERGASMERAVAPDYTDGFVVSACLANGAGDGAEYLAGRGAPLSLDGAAGVGRLDVVKTFFNDDGSLRPGTTEDQLKSGLLYASGRGKTEVIEYLLQKGVDPSEKYHGETALHWASYGAQLEVVKLLLSRTVAVNVLDDHYDGTPLGWALYGWRDARTAERRELYYAVVELLVAAGGTAEMYPAMEKALQNDPRMKAALGLTWRNHP